MIKDVELKISGLTPDASVVELKEVYDAYLEIPVEERSYVSNYKDLSVLLVAADIPFEKEELQYNSGDAGVTVPTEYFSPSDIEALVGLPETLTTAYRSEVLRLWSKINNSVDFDGKQEYTIKLEKAKNEIDAIYAEIEALRKAIKEELYPFDSITLSKRKDRARALRQIPCLVRIRQSAARSVGHRGTCQKQNSGGQSFCGACDGYLRRCCRRVGRRMAFSLTYAKEKN